MDELTLYRLMAEAIATYAKLIDPKTLEYELFDEDSNSIYKDRTHIYAWDQLVYFSKQVITINKRIQRELEDYEAQD